MDDLQTLLDIAVAQHQAGNLDVAEPIYEEILEIDGGHLKTLYLLGTLRLQQGSYASAVELLASITRFRDDVPDVHNNLGIAFDGLGRWDEAADAFQRAIDIRDDYDQAYFNLAALCEKRGFQERAESCYRQAAELNPDDQQALFNLGQMLKTQERWEDAEDCFSKLLTRRLGEHEVLINLGYVLVKQERLDEAIDAYEQVLAQRPQFAEVHNNLSYAWERKGELIAAEKAARKALEIRPDYAEAYNNLGIALRAQRRFDDAIQAFEAAITHLPDFSLAAFNLGATHLLRGDFEKGWPGYAMRSPLLDPPRPTSNHRWKGEHLKGGRLKLVADEGLGDAIQFLRFLPVAAARSGTDVILECPSALHRLVEGIPGLKSVVELYATEGTDDCVAECSLGALPGILGTTIDTIPGSAGYLSVQPDWIATWKPWLQSLEGFRVGLVWQGNPRQTRDAIRSCQLAEFAPLAALPGVQTVCLQVGKAGRAQIPVVASNWGMLDVAAELKDLADTAAVITQLDLVITVDTSVAHLAGALGCPVWTLLSETADWRWLDGRADSPWYQSMRLFRQPAWGDWESVVQCVTKELATIVRSQPKN